jgi:hypothetical protein
MDNWEFIVFQKRVIWINVTPAKIQVEQKSVQVCKSINSRQYYKAHFMVLKNKKEYEISSSNSNEYYDSTFRDVTPCSLVVR